MTLRSFEKLMGLYTADDDDGDDDDFGLLPIMVWYFSQFSFALLGVLLVMKILKDEWYIVIKAYRFW